MWRKFGIRGRRNTVCPAIATTSWWCTGWCIPRRARMFRKLSRLRTVGDIAKIYTVVAPRIITLRGNASQIALAEFLLSELDQAAQLRQNAIVHAYKPTSGGDVTAMVYGLVH